MRLAQCLSIIGTLQRAGDLEATGAHTGLLSELLRKNSGYLSFEEMLWIDINRLIREKSMLKENHTGGNCRVQVLSLISQF